MRFISPLLILWYTIMVAAELTPQHLAHINDSLGRLSPEEIIKWAIITFPSLYQTTAFGLTGLAITDMVSKTSADFSKGQNLLHAVDLIFVDTLYHFPQTYELVDAVEKRYGAKIHVFRPNGLNSEQEFVQKYGDQFWDVNEEQYDYLVKVEPSQRAYKDLGVVAVLTGRRRSQGGARAKLPIVEVETALGVIKINPLHSLDFKAVKKYIDDNKVPYNALLDLGYKSIGDWHSTLPVGEDGDERSGRWAGKAKTECGIHMADSFSHLSDMST